MAFKDKLQKFMGDEQTKLSLMVIGNQKLLYDFYENSEQSGVRKQSDEVSYVTIGKPYWLSSIINDTRKEYIVNRIIVIGSAIIIPIAPPNTPPANTANIVSNGGTLLVLPYILGIIKYPSIWGNITHIINDNTSSLVLTTDAVISAIIFITIPPKYGINGEKAAITPNNKKFGWPIIL